MLAGDQPDEGEERACSRQKGQHVPNLGGKREHDVLREHEKKIQNGQSSEEGRLGRGRDRAV